MLRRTGAVWATTLTLILALAPGQGVSDEPGGGEEYAGAPVDEASDAEAPESEAEAEGGFEWSSLGPATFDLVMLRPLGFIASGAGFLAFVASSPFVAPTWSFSESWDVFVQGPGEYTFERPLGEF